MTGCFICPIHDRVIKNKSDFELGYLLVESAMLAGIVNNLWFVFSSFEQKEKFSNEAKKRFSLDINYIICDMDLSDCKNPVTIKKYFGLKELSDKYDYLATIDCETKFYGVINSGELLYSVWDNETFLNSNISKLGGRDVKKCVEALGLQNNQLLKAETDNYIYSWWFNDIPVYEGKTLNYFFEWIEKKGYQDAIYFNWECFDYLVYVIWLILEQNKHLKKYNIKSRDVIIESLWKWEIRNKKKIEDELGTHWTSRPQIMDGERIQVQFHLDRRDRTIKNFVGRKLGEYGLR